MASDAPAQVPTASSEPAPTPAAAPAVTTPATESATPNATKPAPAPKGGAKDSKTPAADGEKKLSGAELKAKAKAEKLARRAQTKAAVTAAPSASPGGADAKGGKSKQKQDGPQATGGAKGQQGKQVIAPTPVVKDDKPAIPECYSHLSMAKRIKMTQADKDVHPAVLVLGQQMSAFTLDDSTSRLEAMLQALKKVIDSYTTPQGTTFSRHFTSHVLNPQIEYLTACRPMCFSMGNAVRWLKLQVSKIDIDLPDFEAKKLLCESIDSFLHERIVLADLVIVKAAADLIFKGDAVLTYAHHPLVERAFQYARHEQNKDFTVLLVDDPFERIGKEFAKRLVADGIEVSYIPDLSAMRTHLQEASTVFVGAEAMFSNGAMYARAGTCDIAITAMDLGVQVAGLSETINFTERVAMDSLTYNEIDPERHSDAGFRLLFDTTQDKHLTVVITELGNTATTSVAAILRKLEEL
ncbi:translation initiation factor eIF-2B subunit delta [Plectosphaerella plurivora]|uniref:Translation initiation factor eIF2B subunit delta n=1 Tax=Plectosphaerella plurivora TaxID=936078 RepID=A0A9P9A7B3_9PEZI|nr:translation initiation factor eIF-2B subunit delta [Plectosphaerella plurivora]